MQRLNDLSQLHDEMMKDPKYRRQYKFDQECKEYEERKNLLRDLAEMVTLDRLRELVDAERDGRVVVLPCKVGDTVYYIGYCDEVMKECDDDYETGTGAITCPFEDSCLFEACDDSNRRIFETCVSGFWQESDGIWKVFLERINADIRVTDFGKTVFLTRAEAEAKGEQE